MQCFGACSRQSVLEDETVLRDKGQTQVPCDSASSSPVTAANTKLPSLTQPGLTQKPDAALSFEQHAVPDDVIIELPPETGSSDSAASATTRSLAHKQKAGSAGVDSFNASAGSAAACRLHSAKEDMALMGPAASGPLDSVASATGLSLAHKQKAGSATSAGVASPNASSGSAAADRLHPAKKDIALIGSEASARHPQCKSAQQSAQQSAFFAPAVLPNRPAFSRGGRAAHLDQFAMAPQALTASQKKHADWVFLMLGGRQEAKTLMPIQDRLVNRVPIIAGGRQAALKQHPSDQLPNQGLNERLGYDKGTVDEANSSWDYVESPQQSKDFLGLRKCDIRRSLDIDFNSNAPIAPSRRSKEYGERS